MENRLAVHVEGVDGSGKTRLAAWLAEQTNRRLVPTDDPPRDWADCLRRIDARTVPGIVCDRCSGLVSELVYGPVLRGGVFAPGGENELWDIVGSVARFVVWVYCRPPTNALRMTWRDREPADHVAAVKTNVARLQVRYDVVMARVSAVGGRVVRYDWTRDNLETLVGDLELISTR